MDPKVRNVVKILIVVVILTVIVGTIFSGQNTENNIEKETTFTQTTTQTPIQTATQLTPEEEIKGLIIEALDETADITVNKVTGKDQYMVVIKYNASDNLNKDMIIKGIDIECSDVFKALYTSKYDFESVAAVANFPLVDEYGNKSVGPIVKIRLDNETANKIDWDNFLWTNLEDVADSYWLHHDLREVN
jgi:hypothetical protein